jgi:hypothetical protein
MAVRMQSLLLCRKLAMEYTSEEKQVETEKERSMKLEITINLKETDGTPVTEATTIEVEVPDFEAFTGPARFGEVFDAYERKVLKARNEAVAAATEKYLSEMAKKKGGVK